MPGGEYAWQKGGIYMTINIEYETDKPLDVDYEKVANDIIPAALDYEKCPYEAEVNLILTDNDAIQEINRDYRQIDRPTDVLSFPMIDFEKESDFSHVEEAVEDYFNPETGELILGDIIVSVRPGPPGLLRQARQGRRRGLHVRRSRTLP